MVPTNVKEALIPLVAQATLRRLAGGNAYHRGEEYFAGGKVLSLEVRDGKVVAAVEGSAPVPYAVMLWVEASALAYSCTCPRGSEGELCKHGVAVGLAVLAGRCQPAATPPPKAVLTRDDVRAYLARQDKSALVDLLMERAIWDDALREQLFLKAASQHRGGGVDVEVMKEALDRSISPGDYLDWRATDDHARNVEDAVAAIAEVLDRGHAVEAIALAEHALDALSDAMESIDDSNGEMGSILEQVQELHHRACQVARPDPVELARRLFAVETSSGYDVFHGAVITYANILGVDGVAEYRKLAAERWAQVPALGPGQTDPQRYGSRFKLANIMVGLAGLDNDVEAQVAVLARDLSHAYGFLQVAELYRAADLDDQALAWAEKGIAAFPERTDPRLRAFVADAYHRGRRHEDAMALTWTAFAANPTLAAYQDLKLNADRSESWPRWRPKALAAINHIRGRAAAAEKDRRAVRSDRSTLVEIYLWETDLDAAWKEAQDGGCSASLWMRLAVAREVDHPRDVLPIYQRSIEATLRDANKHAYAAAIQQLRNVGRVMARLGDEPGFARYLSEIRTAHARKRNFTRLIDRASWGRPTI